jgi:uncharacterized protein
MLTADLVRVRKRNGQIQVIALKGKTQQRASELAALLLNLVREQEGTTYAHVKEAWEAVTTAPNERKVNLGLQKLIEDDCEFEEHTELSAPELREAVFLSAAAARRDATFDRDQVVERVAANLNLSPAAVDASLYSDLRSEHVLKRASRLTPETLVERYQAGQYQAVLLRAVEVKAVIQCRDPATYRDVFRTLKFRRLLFTIAPRDTGYELTIDGPFSMFESVTKYGVQLALAFSTLRRCDHLQLSARVRWGKQRETLTFEYEHKGAIAAAEGDVLPDDARAFVEAFERTKSAWSIAVNDKLIHLPGVGLCVPDLVFRSGPERIYLEIMGFWSRDAVWKRVELAEHDLPEKVVFAVSSRLRVSEEVLSEAERASLYVYKGVMSPRAVIDKLESLRG